jgi:hypothetical protein
MIEPGKIRPFRQPEPRLGGEPYGEPGARMTGDRVGPSELVVLLGGVGEVEVLEDGECGGDGEDGEDDRECVILEDGE